MLSAQEFCSAPNPIARYYSKFRVSEKLLMTGHSHQAWPDVAFEGQVKAFHDAALFADLKWEKAMEKAERVKFGFKNLLNDKTGHIALGQNTHELLVRLLSALNLKEKPKILTTSGEFHTARRQLDRLAEEGIEIQKITADDFETLAERMAEKVDESYACVIVSHVLFQNGLIVEYLDELSAACEKHSVPLVVDAYHSVGVVPFYLEKLGLENAFILGGGYKYCQLGEGNCFLRIPDNCELRPVITGWFSEFGELAEEKSAGNVVYGKNENRFAGSTYDPVSHYRAAEVFDFFDQNGLTPEFLRKISQYQIKLMIKLFREIDVNPEIICLDRNILPEQIGGFLALRTPKADILHDILLRKGVLTDFRGEFLRFGPAPYLNDDQIIRAFELFSESLKEF